MELYIHIYIYMLKRGELYNFAFLSSKSVEIVLNFNFGVSAFSIL